jgi:hypothetical protein
MVFARELYPAPTPYPMRLPEGGKTEPGRMPLSGRRALEISGKGFPGRPLRLETVSEAQLWLQFHHRHVIVEPGENLVEVDDDEHPIVIAAREPFAEAKLSLRFETGRGSDEASSNSAGLNVLRRRLRQAGIPARQKYDQPLFGVWHLDAFGKRVRTPQAIALIAEVLRRFDFTLISDASDVSETDRVLEVLGPTWRQLAAPLPSSRWSLRPVVIYDSSVVKPLLHQERPFDERRSLLEEHFVGVFEAGGIRLRIIHVEPSPRESSENIARSLTELLGPAQRAPGRVYELTLVAGFMGIEGPESAALSLLAEADIEIPTPLTRHGDNPALDQIAIYPKSEFITGTAGLVDLYQNSPRALFSGGDVTNEEAVAQLSVRSPAWALVVRPP